MTTVAHQLQKGYPALYNLLKENLFQLLCHW